MTQKLRRGLVKFYRPARDDGRRTGYGFVVAQDSDDEFYLPEFVLRKAGIVSLDEWDPVEFDHRIKDGRAQVTYLRMASFDVSAR